MRISRSITEPIRQNLSWEKQWKDCDQGLIACWERGREKSNEDPALAAQARDGRLVVLPWKGGAKKATKKQKQHGTLNYLAMWQGLRGDDLNIPLAPTTDILASARGAFVRVGFAAESENLVVNAKAKVRSKGLDLIAANDITAEDSGFGADTNRVTLIDGALNVEELPLLTKYEVGNRILDRVLRLFRD